MTHLELGQLQGLVVGREARLTGPE